MNIRSSLALALVVSFAVTALSASTPLRAAHTECEPAQSTVNVNQSVTLEASGGDGDFRWSGQNLNVTNPTGDEFVVSYNQPGTYMVNVESDGHTDSCTIVVRAVSVGDVMCSPAVQTASIGQRVTFSASGGDGDYVWSSPDLTISEPRGAGFSAMFADSGIKTVSVRSDGDSSTCTVNVLAGSVPAPSPGFPNTGAW